jgi:signal transduction histidine kinase
MLSTYLNKIDSSAEKMVQLIKDVLMFSRLSHEQSAFVRVDLNKVIKNVVAEYEMIIQERSALVELTPLPTVYGIPVQLHQLFSNLLSNALKFNNGIPKIQIAYCQKPQSSSHLEADPVFHITVIDNGIGFEQKYANEAFQPFRRLSTQFEGTGIGLSLCRRIAENHKGSITVKSQVGKGSMFEITLPAVLQ